MKRYLHDSDLETLFSQFVAENMESSFSAFSKNVLFNVIKPKANDWGICLCVYCLNPELKVEALSDLKILPPISLEENITNEEGLQNIISQLDFLSIVFQEWCKIESQLEGSKISRKISCSEKNPRICEASQERYFFLKEHSERIELQYSCFKKARIEVKSSDGETATIHIDWSEAQE